MIPAATLPGRMKGRHVVQVIIAQTILIPDHAVFLARWRVQAEHGHAKVLEHKQQMVLPPLRLKMRQKLNALVLHTAQLQLDLAQELAREVKVIVLILELTRGLHLVQHLDHHQAI